MDAMNEAIRSVKRRLRSTQILVRFLVEDDARQSAAAAALVERTLQNDELLYLSGIVLCETIWVLTINYRIPRPDVIRTLQELLRAKHLTFDYRTDLRVPSTITQPAAAISRIMWFAKKPSQPVA